MKTLHTPINIFLEKRVIILWHRCMHLSRAKLISFHLFSIWDPWFSFHRATLPYQDSSGIHDFLPTQLCNTLIALTLVFLMGSISTKSLILQSHLSRTHTFNLKDIIKFCILKTWTLPNCHYGSCMLLYQYSTTAHNNYISSHEKH